MLDRIKKAKNNDSGFTIIEVMIVLAIAGLIILIVFLAVPALQRNSRNTQRKNDVSAIGAALNEYTNNNGGALPLDNTSFQNNVRTNAKTGFYDPATATAVVYTKNAAAAAPGGPAAGVLDVVQVQTYAKCQTATTVYATGNGQTARDVIALYRVEAGGSTSGILQCQEL